MKAVIKYSVLLYNGKKASKKAVYNDCPDFETIVHDSFLEPGKKLYTTVEDQIDDWVSGFDKSTWMAENEISLIFNWEVISAEITIKAVGLPAETKQLVNKAKPQKLTTDQILQVFVQLPGMEKLKDDFSATYQTMKPAIKNLSYKKQIEIVLQAIGVAYKSANNVFDRLNEMENDIKRQTKGKTHLEIKGMQKRGELKRKPKNNE